MHVCDLASNPPIGTWVVDWSQTGQCDYDDLDAVIEMHRPVLQILLRDAARSLSEMNYKQLAQAIDPNFLKQGVRARALRGVYYQGFFNPNAPGDFSQQRITDTMWFKVTSALHEWNGLDYDCFVKLAPPGLGRDSSRRATCECCGCSCHGVVPVSKRDNHESGGRPMKVEGEDAKRFDAVRLDSFECANAGELISADDQTGAIAWKDKAGEPKSVTLGAHAIRIVLKGRH